MEALLDFISSASQFLDTEWDMDHLWQYQRSFEVFLTWLLACIDAYMDGCYGMPQVHLRGLFRIEPISRLWGKVVTDHLRPSLRILFLFDTANRSVEPLTLSHRMNF